MDQRISLITLAVADVARSRAFYVDGLGWTPELEAPGVLIIRAGEHLLFSLWSETEFEEEVGPINRGPGVAPLTLAHNVGPKAQVDDVLRTARVAGADPVAVTEGPEDGGPPPPAWVAVDRDWGGYSGYFGDPDGYRWEIACAPGQVNDIVVPRE